LTAASSGCGQNIYKAPDGVTVVTAEMAIAEWYSQGQYLNPTTGLATAGFETEA